MSLWVVFLAGFAGSVVGSLFVLFVQALSRAEDSEIEGEMERQGEEKE
jgi:uncharacterized membrane protein